MDTASLLIGVLIGFVLGAGSIIFYMRWKMTAQLNAMQENMDEMFDTTEQMMEGLEEDKEE